MVSCKAKEQRTNWPCCQGQHDRHGDHGHIGSEFLRHVLLKDVAKEFGTDVTMVSVAIMLTLAARPIGALLFGLAADHYGRRVTLMADILLFSMLEFASGLA